jgi:hypothetical protein
VVKDIKDKFLVVYIFTHMVNNYLAEEAFSDIETIVSTQNQIV